MRGEPWDPLGAGRSPAVFVVFSFISAVDLIISLEEDGYISGFAEVFVREVPPHPISPHRGLPHAPAVQRAAPRTQLKRGCCSCTRRCSCRSGTVHGAAPAPAVSRGEGVWEGVFPHPT